MKKLMIAAAAAAMVGGAFADNFAGLYNLKFTLKTLAPKTLTDCDCTICKTEGGDYYEPGTVKLEGIIAYCSACTLVGENYATAALALWDPTNKEPVFFNDAWKVAKTVEGLYDAAGSENVAVSNVFTMIDTTVYGKSSLRVGMDFVMDYKDDVRDGTWDLRAAGLGRYAWDGNLGYVKNVSGNVAGRIPWLTGYKGTKGKGEYWGATIVANECAGAAQYCEADKTNGNWEYPVCEENPSVPAYGTWSMKRNATATNKDLYKSLPSWLR